MSWDGIKEVDGMCIQATKHIIFKRLLEGGYGKET